MESVGFIAFVLVLFIGMPSGIIAGIAYGLTGSALETSKIAKPINPFFAWFAVGGILTFLLVLIAFIQSSIVGVLISFSAIPAFYLSIADASLRKRKANYKTWSYISSLLFFVFGFICTAATILIADQIYERAQSANKPFMMMDLSFPIIGGNIVLFVLFLIFTVFSIIRIKKSLRSDSSTTANS